MPPHLPAEKEGQAWLTALFNLAKACYLMPDDARAQQNFEKLLSMPSLPPLLEAYTHLGLGHLGLARQDYARAHQWLEQGQQKWKKHRPEGEDTLLMRFWEAEAEMYQKQSEWNEAQRIFERLGQSTAIAPAEKAFWLCREAEMYYQQGQLSRAEARYQAAVQTLKSISNPEPRTLIPLLNNLGTLHKNQSRYAEAATLYQMAEEYYARASPPKPISLLLSTWQNQSRLQRSQARYREAALIIARGLEQAQTQQNDYWSAAFALEEAHLLRQTGQPAAAEAKYYALETYFFEKGHRADYFEIIRQRFNLLLQTGRYQKAIEVLQPLLEMTADSLREGHTLLADLSVPLLTINTSGGARQQEGVIALMQMAKVTMALTRLSSVGQPHIAVLVDPCYGGVTASYPSVADQS
ncbi:MAG: tetratricopeptide repeat protein, partial [Microscillaceae bacterium]|nr:tetratricopeptide repeat protein [Microscillaceae bacterium]